MKVKKLKKLFNRLDIRHEDITVKIFDKNNEYIGDIKNITVENHSGKDLIILNTSIESLK
jgi:hypothetical protein